MPSRPVLSLTYHSSVIKPSFCNNQFYFLSVPFCHLPPHAPPSPRFMSRILHEQDMFAFNHPLYFLSVAIHFLPPSYQESSKLATCCMQTISSPHHYLPQLLVSVSLLRQPGSTITTTDLDVTPPFQFPLQNG